MFWRNGNYAIGIGENGPVSWQPAAAQLLGTANQSNKPNLSPKKKDTRDHW